MKQLLNKFLKLDLNVKLLYLFMLIIFIIKFYVFFGITKRFWWDEIIYVSLAKYLYSFGVQGLFDGVRPVLFSFFIGLFWKLGFDIVIVAKLVIIIVSILNIFLLYKISEKVFKGTGLYSALIYGSTSVFIFLSSFIMSELFSMFFILLAFYFIMNKKYFFSGFFVGVAFLSRFFNGIFLVIICLYLFFNVFRKRGRLFDVNRVKKRVVHYVLGFLVVVIPYFIANYIYFGDVLHTIKRAGLVILDSAFLYDFNMFYYLKVLFLENYLIFFLIVFFFFFNFNKKLWGNKEVNFILVSFLIPFVYLSLVVIHKEERYVFGVIPFLSILGGIVLSFIISKLCSKFNKGKYKNVINLIIFIGYVSLFIVLQLSLNNVYDNYNEDELEFYNFFNNNIVDESEVVLLSNDVTFLMFSDVKVYSLPFWDFWKIKIEESNYSINYVALKLCDFYCVDGALCSEKDEFLEFLISSNSNRVFEKNIEIQENKFCQYEIYKLNNIGVLD